MSARRRPAAGPWGGAVLAEVRSRLAEGWPPGLTTLTGEDLFHLDRAQAAILDHLAPDRRDAFTLTVFSDGKLSAAEAVAAASAVGMFSRRRVVLVRDVALLDGPADALEAFAASPPRESWLLVRAPRLDRKRKLHQALAAARLLQFDPPGTPSEVQASLREIVAMAKERGQRIDPGDAALLAESCRGDLLRVERELDRLRDWAGGEGHRWSRRELEAHLGGAASVTGWEVGDALIRADRKDALAAVRRVLDAGGEPIPVVGGLAWRARIFLAARARVEAGEPAEAVVRSAGAWGWADALRDGLRRWSLEEALRIPARLLEADRQLKSRGLAGSAVLESVVDDLLPEGRR
jgi:DNA polymerase-3 subunit delta